MFLRRETGQSSLARTRSKTWAFLWNLHICALRFFCFKPFTSQNHDPKTLAITILSDDCSRYVFQREFNAPPGARRFLYRMMLKLWLCVVSELIPDGKLVWHWCGVVSKLIRNIKVVWWSDSRYSSWKSWSTDGFNYRRQNELGRYVFSVTCYRK